MSGFSSNLRDDSSDNISQNFEETYDFVSTSPKDSNKKCSQKCEKIFCEPENTTATLQVNLSNLNDPRGLKSNENFNTLNKNDILSEESASLQEKNTLGKKSDNNDSDNKSCVSEFEVEDVVEDHYLDTIANRHFKFHISEYRISKYDLKCDDEKWLNDKIREVLRNIMKNEKKYRTCPLQFYGGIHNPKDSIVLYAKCRYSSHKQSFRFVITINEPDFYDIYITSKEDCPEVIHKGPRIVHTLNGKERQDISETLKITSSRDYHMKLSENADLEICAEGGMQKYVNLPTIQKIKSEAVCKKDSGGLKSSHLQDLIQKAIDDQKLRDPYIRHVSIPFTVAMFSLKQLSILSKDDDVAGFDATGNVSYRPNDIYCKKFYITL